MAKNNVWMSVSDLMTGLMVIFLFIAIAYMIRVRDDISEYKDTKEKIYNLLKEKFSDKELANGTISVNPDLSLRFLQATTQFSSGQRTLPESFALTLDSIMPKYLDVLVGLDDTLKSKLKEIRIEGHTDTDGYPELNEDPYRANLVLSQERARNVLFHILDIIDNQNYSDKDVILLQHLLTANGYSYSRALDDKGEEVYLSKNSIDPDKSRRVEIRIITDEKSILEKLISRTKVGTKADQDK